MTARFSNALLAGAAIISFAIPAQTVRAQEAQETQDILETYEDGAQVTLSGTVEELADESFTLDYGAENSIEVEVGDWDWADETSLKDYLQNGERVVVSGEFDDGFFETREIEADNIYFNDDYAYYYVIDRNPAYAATFNGENTMRDGTFVSARGEVTDVSGRQFTLAAQGMDIQVDTSGLSYNPLDQQQGNISQGDRVFVFGEMDQTFFNNREIEADAVVKVSDVRQQRGGQAAAQGQQQQQQSRQQQDQQPPQRQSQLNR